MQSTCLIIGVAALALFLALALGIRNAAFRDLDLDLSTRFNARFQPGEGGSAHKVERAMRDLTALGGDMLTGLFLLAGTGLLAALGRGDEAMRFAGLLIAARVIGFAIKAVIKRDRPRLAGRHLRSFTSSFPSVHTLMVFTGSFALLGAADVASGAALAWAGALAALIGFTRLYFAVHWPSDVLAGWLAGLAICAFSASLGGV